MLPLQWGQGTEHSPTRRSPKLPLLLQSATRSHRTPFSAPRPLARTAPNPPGASEGKGRVFKPTLFPGALPLSDSPGLCQKMAIALIQKWRLSASVCLSLAQRKTDTQNQLECSPPVFSGFYTGSFLPIARHNLTAPNRPQKWRAQGKGKKTEKDQEKGRKEKVMKLPVPKNSSLLPRPLLRATSTTQTAKGKQTLEGIQAIECHCQMQLQSQGIKPFWFFTCSTELNNISQSDGPFFKIYM